MSKAIMKPLGEVERWLLEAPLFLRGIVSRARTLLNGGRRVSIA
jgi:hypothetical protein